MQMVQPCGFGRAQRHAVVLRPTYGRRCKRVRASRIWKNVLVNDRAGNEPSVSVRIEIEEPGLRIGAANDHFFPSLGIEWHHPIGGMSIGGRDVSDAATIALECPAADREHARQWGAP